MIQATMVTLMMLSPILTVAALLALAEWRDRRRAAALARQVRLTDALADELGAVVAPVVSRSAGGAWRVAMQVPVGRPALVARVLAIAQDTLPRIDAAPYELVLTPQAGPAALVRPGMRPARQLRVA
jgi:hypothetical protein